jgi:hypothetical protein
MLFRYIEFGVAFLAAPALALVLVPVDPCRARPSGASARSKS